MNKAWPSGFVQKFHLCIQSWSSHLIFTFNCNNINTALHPVKSKWNASGWSGEGKIICIKTEERKSILFPLFYEAFLHICFRGCTVINYTAVLTLPDLALIYLYPHLKTLFGSFLTSHANIFFLIHSILFPASSAHTVSSSLKHSAFCPLLRFQLQFHLLREVTPLTTPSEFSITRTLPLFPLEHIS